MNGVRIALAHEYDGPGGAEMMVLQLAEELRRREYEVIPVLPVPRLGWLGDEFTRRGFMEPETYRVRRALDPKGLLEITEISC